MLTCYGPADECCNVNVSGWEADANTTNVLAFATDTSCDMYPRSTLAVVPDTWTHVAVTVDSAAEEVAFYVDGEARRRKRHREAAPPPATAAGSRSRSGRTLRAQT